MTVESFRKMGDLKQVEDHSRWLMWECWFSGLTKLFQASQGCHHLLLYFDCCSYCSAGPRSLVVMQLIARQHISGCLHSHEDFGRHVHGHFGVNRIFLFSVVAEFWDVWVLKLVSGKGEKKKRIRINYLRWILNARRVTDDFSVGLWCRQQWKH